VVSVAVGIILFDAGLGLKVSKLTGTVARVYRRLVSIGILVTWAVGTVAAYLLDWRSSGQSSSALGESGSRLSQPS
jgi:NhaP-type Na+/H+ or K+/H+ antiporter